MRNLLYGAGQFGIGTPPPIQSISTGKVTSHSLRLISRVDVGDKESVLGELDIESGISTISRYLSICLDAGNLSYFVGASTNLMLHADLTIGVGGTVILKDILAPLDLHAITSNAVTTASAWSFTARDEHFWLPMVNSSLLADTTLDTLADLRYFTLAEVCRASQGMNPKETTDDKFVNLGVVLGAYLTNGGASNTPYALNLSFRVTSTAELLTNNKVLVIDFRIADTNSGDFRFGGM